MRQQIFNEYYQAVFDTDRGRALAVIRTATDAGVTPEEIVFEVVVPSIEKMIKAFTADFDATLAQHFLASQIAAEVTEAMLPLFKKAPRILGHVVLGTSHGDFHGLGKRIVSGCLKANMIGVTDLGLNVPPERFVEAAVDEGAQIIGVSSMMVHTARGESGPIRVRELIEARGLKDRIRLIVGGAPYRFDHGLYREVGADGWAENGFGAARVVADYFREMKA